MPCPAPPPPSSSSSTPGAPPVGTATPTPGGNPTPQPTPTPGDAAAASSRKTSQKEAVVRATREAQLIEEQIIPHRLRTILGFDETEMTVLGPRLYLLQLTRGIKDPVEKMLVQEFTVAHHRLMQLHTQASAAHGLEAVKVYNSAVARLQGELRRVALTIKAYRQPPAQKSFAVITQQNVVSGGDQHVQYVDMGQGKESLVARDELKGKTDNPLENRINGTFPGTGEEPAACGGGTAERQQAAPLVG